MSFRIPTNEALRRGHERAAVRPDGDVRSRRAVPVVQRRKLNLKATFESCLSYFSFKSLIPGAFNVGLIGSSCTALPWLTPPVPILMKAGGTSCASASTATQGPTFVHYSVQLKRFWWDKGCLGGGGEEFMARVEGVFRYLGDVLSNMNGSG